MATAAAKATNNGQVAHPDHRYNPLNSLSDSLQLSYSQVDNRVEPYELVEIFYGSSSVSPATHASQLSPRSAGTSSPEIMQVLNQTDKDRQLPDSYTCDVCGRHFREASHFTKHKRGALCRKLALRMAKKNKRKKTNGNDCMKKNILQKPYHCNVCGAKFCDKVNVELHIERQHNSKQQLWVEISKSGGFTCAECGRWFQDRSNLVEHQKQHMQTYLHQNDRVNHPGDRLPIHDRPVVQQPHNVAVAYYHEAIHHAQNYGQQPQPPHLPPPPPAPPPVAHMHPNMSTILHTPQLNPTNLTPSTQSVPQPLMHSHASLQNTNLPSNTLSDNTSKLLKGNKPNKLVTNSLWNVCGDCGHKFVDPMNLEIHMQRVHPDSFMVETVNLGCGTILYKTNNTQSDVQSLLNQNGSVNSNAKQTKPNSQTFDCILCGFKATTRNYILYHLQNVHRTSNSDFIHVLETLESPKRNSKGAKGKKGNQDPLLREQRHACEACKAVFLSKAELIRHRIKDKQYTCGICCHSSCSQMQMTSHMATHHPLAENNRTISGNGLVCWVCGVVSPSATVLDNHMSTHGTLSVKCVACGKTSDKVGTLVPHLSTHHSGLSSRVKLTLSRSGQPCTPYTTELEVFLDGTVTAQSSFTSSSTSKASASGTEPTHIPPAYACSECGACLPGAAQLEAHLRIHQSPNSSTTQGSSSSSSSFATTTQAVPSSSSSLSTVCVDKVPGSFEFRCEECGFWRQESEPVMRHIQAVHMSGNMLHSVKLPSGVVQIYPIHVVTPISSLSTQ